MHPSQTCHLREIQSNEDVYWYNILTAVVAMAQQAPSFENQQRTSGVVGITSGQTARLNVLYPIAPAPILQRICSVSLAIADNQGTILKSNAVASLTAGKSVSLDLNADSDLAGARTQIHGLTVAPTGCQLIATLEVIDNSTQKTIVVIGSELTYPVPVFSQPTQPTGNMQADSWAGRE